MKTLFNFPEIITRDKDLKSISKFYKMLLFLKGILFIFIINKTKGTTFCILINIFYSKQGKIYFRENQYFKLIGDRRLHFPNKRILRVVGNHVNQLNQLFQDYCLESIDFNKGDVIVDCGANVGELYFAFQQNNIQIKYFAFEPDSIIFKSLVKNINEVGTAYAIALSDNNGNQKIYLDSDGANSSLSYFGNDNSIEVETRTIDSFEFPSIKLLKLEAEGFEPEVLLGSKISLKNIEYISVDYGNERGIEQKSTKVEVTNFLFNQNFEMTADSKNRKIGLFRNRSYS